MQKMTRRGLARTGGAGLLVVAGWTSPASAAVPKATPTQDDDGFLLFVVAAAKVRSDLVAGLPASTGLIAPVALDDAGAVLDRYLTAPTAPSEQVTA